MRVDTWRAYRTVVTALVCYAVLVGSVQAARAKGGPNPATSVKTHPLLSAADDATVFHEEQATSAAAFVDSVGVQTHFNYIDTPYANWQLVINEITRLGVHHVRDALPMTSPLIGRHRQLVAHEIRCTCGFAFDKNVTAQSIVNAARSASDVEALEAPNECDAGTNCGGGGEIGIANVTALLPVLGSAARILQVPLIGPSFTRREAYASTGPITKWVAANNLHVYFGGRYPGTEGWGDGDAQGNRYGSLAWWLDQSQLNAPGLPIEITETGYESFDHPIRPGTIPFDVEAKYLLRTLLLAWNRGVRRTFIYELLDEFPGSGYGLLRHDLTEKPAFLALRNLLSILHDSPMSAKAGSLRFSMKSTDPSLSHTLLQKADGSYDLILWLERNGYNDSIPRGEVLSPSESVSLKFDPKLGISQVISFNEDGSTKTEGLSTTPSTLLLNVTDRITILKILARP
jgi:hypothetical protein